MSRAYNTGLIVATIYGAEGLRFCPFDMDETVYVDWLDGFFSHIFAAPAA